TAVAVVRLPEVLQIGLGDDVVPDRHDAPSRGNSRTLPYHRHPRRHDSTFGAQYRFAARQLQPSVEIALRDVRVDTHVQAGAQTGRHPRSLAHYGDATVESLGLQAVRRIVGAHAKL